MTQRQKKMLARIIASAAALAAVLFIPSEGIVRFALFMVPYLIAGYDVLLKAVKGVRNLQPFDEYFLMSVATVGAIALAVYSGSGDYTEAVAVMLFYQVGEWFQGWAVGRSRRNITELMDIRPDYANLEQDGKTEKVDPDEVEPGSVIVVNPGEKVPIDGTVIEGTSSVDTAALTGESIPRDIAAGCEVISGSVNLSGVIRVRTEKEFGESTASKILDLVENASSRKSRSEEFITKFARIYTPAVVFLALALALLPPLVRLLAMSAAPEWSVWVYRALIFLVISCPCALVISIPLSFFAGLGGASRAGVLIKGSNYMETLSKADTLVFDKTGTLTKGVFEVSAIHRAGVDDRTLLRAAAGAESASSHPIARSLERAYGGKFSQGDITDIHETGGRGVSGLVDGKKVLAGSARFLRESGIEPKECQEPGTIVHVAIDGKYVGHIHISDVIKETSPAAVRALRKAGVKRTVMLTGDAEAAATDVASKIGIDEVRSGLLPQDKVAEIEKIIEANKTGKTAFAGDGINDAPVLSRADVGIAMGALGSDAAIEAADVVLMDDNPQKIATAIRIAKKCMAIVYENIVFAIFIKVLCLILGAIGIANMWFAIFADVGVMILCVLNAIRTLMIAGIERTVEQDGK